MKTVFESFLYNKFKKTVTMLIIFFKFQITVKSRKLAINFGFSFKQATNQQRKL